MACGTIDFESMNKLYDLQDLALLIMCFTPFHDSPPGKGNFSNR